MRAEERRRKNGIVEMNTIREIERINERELELGIKVGHGSWHDEYADSAYVFLGENSFIFG